MKDYYKILGVREDASSADIRNHYVELAKQYHPDVKKSTKESSEIKEINEAYGILRDAAARMDYDLKRSLRRTYLKKRRQERERPRLVRRAVFSFAILCLAGVFSLAGFFLWKKIGVPLQPLPGTYHPIHPIRTQVAEREVRVKEVSPKAVSPTRQKPSRTIEANTVKTRGSSAQAATPEEPKRKIEQTPPPIVQPRPDPVIASPLAPAPSVSKQESPIPLKQERTVSLVSEQPATNKAELPTSSSPDQPIRSKAEQPIRLKPEPTIRRVALPSPPLLLEDEVRQFLANYMDRYVHKDIQGFLSLFSPKAIQNGKDGLDMIRTIYLKFFDQSERLIYRLEDIKIVIDGADAEVTGYYQVTQKFKKQQNEKLWKGSLRCVLTKGEEGLKIVSLDYRHQKD